MKRSQHIWPEAFVLRWLCITTVAVDFLFSKRKQYLMFFSFPFLSMALVVHIPKQGRFHFFCDQFPAALLCNIQKNTWQMYKIILSLPKQYELLSRPAPSLVLPSASQQSYEIFISILIVFFHSIIWGECCHVRLFRELRKPSTAVHWSHWHAGMFVFRSTCELLILAMSLSTLHSLPVTDPYFYMEWRQHGIDYFSADVAKSLWCNFLISQNKRWFNSLFRWVQSTCFRI